MEIGPTVDVFDLFVARASSGVVTEPTHFCEIAPALNVPALPAGQIYYWRVMATNFLGQASTPSVALQLHA